MLGVVVAAATALMPARQAAAHANLAQSDPVAQSSVTRAPERVRLVFTEPVEPRFIEVRVLDRDRKQVDQGDAGLVPGTTDQVQVSLGDLPEGIYTISWKVVSTVDGHTTQGLVPFNVGDPGAAPEPLSAEEIGREETSESAVQKGPAGVVARWGMLLAVMALGGLSAGVPLLLAPAARLLESLRGTRDDAAVTAEANAAVEADALERVREVSIWALIIFAVGSVLLLLVDAAAAAGTGLGGAIGSPVVDLLGTRRGTLWLLRTTLGAGVLAVLLVRPKTAGSKLWWLVAALAGGMMLATSLGSHSASGERNTTLATIADWVHQAAVSVWVGGLLFLVLALLPSLRPLGGPARTRLLADVIRRFSTLAMVAVGVAAVTGLFQTWTLLDRIGDITEITWGRALIVKLLLVVAVIGVAAFNLLVVKPRLSALTNRMDRPSREQAAALRTQFRRAVGVEAGLAVLVVLVVGVLTGVSPGRVAQGITDGPFRPFILDSAAEGMAGRLVLSPGRIGVNRFDLALTPDAGGTLPNGTEVTLRISTVDQDTGINEAPMESLGGGRFTTVGAFLSTVGLWDISAVIRPPAGDDVVISFRLQLTESTGRPQVQESRPAAPLSRGREIYATTCAQCHGTAGKGDGPLAAGLRPPPLDLTVHVPQHGDADLANWISNGVPRTAMPAFGGQFTPEEIQALVNYLRDLARQANQDR